jgi:hypothetical protein
MEHIPPAAEPIQDPRNFYAVDSPVSRNSDSDQELYESAEDFEETLEPEDQGVEQVGGSSLGLGVSFSRFTCAVFTNNSDSEAVATVRAIPGLPWLT